MAHTATETPVERVLSRLDGVKASGTNRWMAKCPAHDDRQASLSITVGKDDRAVMYCHAKCTVAAIVAAAGLTMSDLFIDRPAEPANGKAPGVEQRAKLVKSYDYTDADGRLLYQACRFEPKTFRQRRPSGAGDWIYNLEGVEPVLYRLPELIEAVATSKRVFVVEGEKDADALIDEGVMATTSPMGAGKWRESYGSALAGADVVVLPDNDEPGRLHAIDVAKNLVAHGCTVRIVDLPGLPPKGDVSDWLDAGGDFDELDELIARTPRYSSDPTQQARRTRWRLDELLERDDLMRPPPPVVPYLAWASRSTLLAAREKSGKSTLTGYMAACVSRGKHFLDEPTQQGPVLIVGLEEYLGDTARRLAEFDADPLGVSLVDSFARAPGERIGELDEHISTVRPVLVILDSLMAYAMGGITDANNATQMQAVVDSLTQLCHHTGVALVIIHHAKKSDGRYRDSSAIGGAVDIIAEIFSPDEAADPRRRRVRPIGRVPSRAVDFIFDGRRYLLADADGHTKAPIEQRILDVLRERPGISANDVADAIGEQRKHTLDRLKFMLNQRQIINDGDSRFFRLRLPSIIPNLGLS
jgi:putative DNA primase/helicase